MRRFHPVAMNSFGAAAALTCGLLASCLSAQPIAASRAPTTPIEHLIVVVGENISFDNLFATYEPPPGETIANLPRPRSAGNGTAVGARRAVSTATATARSAIR
jgi:phospholipase C